MNTAHDRQRKVTQDLWICLGLLALTVAVYWPVGLFEFVSYDDTRYVSEHLRVQMGLTLENAAWAFRTTFFENWHPLTWLSYMMDAQLFGLRAGAFHLVNLGLHLINTLLVFSVFKRMTGARWPSAFVAAIFAVHPLHVESVAWISERKDVLSGCFWLLTLWSYIRYTERPGISRYLATLVLFALGLMCKPMLVTLPLVLLLLDVWPLARAGAQAGAAARPGLIVEKIPFFLLSAISSFVTFFAQHAAMTTTVTLPFGKRLANALISYLRYLSKTLWPDNLSVFYPHPGQWMPWQVTTACLLLIGVSVLVLRASRKRPYLAVGWWWFLGTLVPVIGLVQVGGQSMADRYMYIPLIGLALMVGWGASDFWAEWEFKPAGLVVAAGGLVLGCVVLSSFQVRCWQNTVTLFEHALAVTQANTVAHDHLGRALLSQGRTNDAIVHFSAALELDPEDFWAYGNLGNILLRQGKFDEAGAKYQKALQISPQNPELNHNLGLCLARQKKFNEAIPYFSTALQFSSDYADAHFSLADALMGVGRTSEAVSNYLAVLALKPKFTAAHFNVAVALTQQGKMEEAAAHYSEVLRLEPGNALAESNLGMVLARQGKTGEASQHLAEAARLKPEEPQFHFHLATVFGMENRTQQAIQEYGQALRLQPEMVPAMNNLAWILATDPDDKLRNGARAIQLAERACELTGHQQAFLLGTLGAAYAEAGRFAEATNSAQTAANIAIAAGQKEIAATNEKLLELYRAGKPYHEARKPN